MEAFMIEPLWLRILKSHQETLQHKPAKTWLSVNLESLGPSRMDNSDSPNQKRLQENTAKY